MTHPKNHDWAIKGDIVTDKRRGAIWAFERHEGCTYCTRLRKRVIEIRPRWVMNPPTYSGQVIPMEERTSSEDTVRVYVLETTPSEDIRSAAKPV